MWSLHDSCLRFGDLRFSGRWLLNPFLKPVRVLQVVGLAAPTERERYAIRRHFDIVCFSSLDRRDAITPRFRMRVMRLGQPFLPLPPPLLLSHLLFLLFSSLVRSHLYYLPKAAYVRRKSFVLNLTIRSRNRVDPLKNGWRGEEVKRIWANGRQKGMWESNTELCAQTRRLYYIERSNEPSGMHTKPF